MPPILPAPLCPDSLDLYRKYKGMLTVKDWGDGVERVCIMSMFVPGAKNSYDCVTKGWPKWMVDTIIYLFDTTNILRLEHEEEMLEWTYEIAQLINQPISYNSVERVFFLLILRDIIIDTLGYTQFEDQLSELQDDPCWKDELYRIFHPDMAYFRNPFSGERMAPDSPRWFCFQLIRSGIQSLREGRSHSILNNFVDASWSVRDRSLETPTTMYSTSMYDKAALYRGFMITALEKSIVSTASTDALLSQNSAAATATTTSEAAL